MDIQATGLLFSQVGYEPDASKRVLVRGPKGFLPASAKLELLSKDGESLWSGPLKAWGEKWRCHWWIADLTDWKQEGEFGLRLNVGGKALLEATGLKVGKGVLYDATVPHVAVGCLRRRGIFATVNPGWMDAGILWMEVPSHATAIVGLCDVLEQASPSDGLEMLDQVASLAADGCDYLGQCQDAAEKKGHGVGPLVHDLAKAPDTLCVHDAFMGALAFAKTARALRERNAGLAGQLAARAGKALDWIETKAQPMDEAMLEPYNQGWPAGEPLPRQWSTRYLMLALWAEALLAQGGWRQRPDRMDVLSAAILARKVPQSGARDGLWGHYSAYDTGDVDEKSWSHGMPANQNNQNSSFGADMGAVFAHPSHCFVEALAAFPDHALAEDWRQALTDFGEGYFKPACAASPFGILPRGRFGEEGLLWFSGLWHGCNTSYGQAAALALELEKATGDSAYADLAQANLQWICGLNAGVTADAIRRGCVVDSQDVEPGRAVPASMIKGVGVREAGNWTNIRGSICNGFGTGAQFKYDVAPTGDDDAPEALHDEDWITHNGGFLMGVSRWHARKAD